MVANTVYNAICAAIACCVLTTATTDAARVRCSINLSPPPPPIRDSRSFAAAACTSTLQQSRVITKQNIGRRKQRQSFYIAEGLYESENIYIRIFV